MLIKQLLTESPHAPNLFDVPDATVRQRGTCFVLLADRKLTEIIDETFT